TEGAAHARGRRVVVRRRQEAAPARAHGHGRPELPPVPCRGHALRRDPARQLRHRGTPQGSRRRRSVRSASLSQRDAGGPPHPPPPPPPPLPLPTTPPPLAPP